MRHDMSSSGQLGKIAAKHPARVFGRLSSRFDLPLEDVRQLLFLPVADVAFEAYLLEGRHAAFLKNESTPKSSKYPYVL
jgi:hypothetical protein